MPLIRFHENHGVNIELRHDNQVARRSASFANAITFSDRPLRPGELFLVEVEEHEPGWSGHLRCGLTQHHPASLKASWPRDRPSNRLALDSHPQGQVARASSAPVPLTIPQYSMPDLTNMGKSWIFAITKHHNRVPDEQLNLPEMEARARNEFIKDGVDFLKIGCSEIPKHFLVQDFIALDQEASWISGQQQYFATSVGSRIAVTYQIHGDRVYMHFIINGEDQGASLMEDAKLDSPFYGIVDVYGTTKQVKIVQLIYVPSLQECCRVSIRAMTSEAHLQELPLPNKLKRYLQYKL
ncbi:neuralized-like protein 2 [Acanthaster planci]|uniref:Neuralized-like protein 2 n=1 Tax=Acanthaster planci TaxID=133434 RepID=A0A8B8A1S5_ACAPL|nr:neuralized-like protein 2 [Acanthaster planci]